MWCLLGVYVCELEELCILDMGMHYAFIVSFVCIRLSEVLEIENRIWIWTLHGLYMLIIHKICKNKETNCVSISVGMQFFFDKSILRVRYQ